MWMWELDHEEDREPKNWCFWTVVLEKTLESPLDCKEIQPVHPKGDQSWIFIAGAEAPIPWPADVKNWLRKRPWCWERLKTGGEGDHSGWDNWMASPTQWAWMWATLGVGEGQGSLVCCRSQGCKESDMTEQLNWTECSSSILAWKIPWAEEPGGIQSIGLPRVGHDLATEPAHTHQDNFCMHWETRKFYDCTAILTLLHWSGTPPRICGVCLYIFYNKFKAFSMLKVLTTEWQMHYVPEILMHTFRWKIERQSQVAI